MTPRIQPSAFTCILYEVRDHVAVVTLNRPDRRNALNRRAYDEVEAAFRAASADPEVRCVIVTGADPAFCSGEDVKEMMTGEQHEQSVARLTSVRPEPTPAAVAALWRLPAIVGPAKAAEFLFTGDVINAAEARRIGLVSEVVPHEELMVARRHSPGGLPSTRRLRCVS
jgi:enoyl-CoA hydratase/carnithine racemase